MSEPSDDLASRPCVACRGGTPPLRGEAIAALLPKLDGWRAEGAHHLTKEFAFKDFRDALAFVNRVGELAEAQRHHPDVHLAWGRVRIDVWTHKIDGLTESDFVLAAKIDRLPR